MVAVCLIDPGLLDRRKKVAYATRREQIGNGTLVSE